MDKVFEKSKGKGSKWIKEACRLSARPGEDTNTTFTLPSHVKDNLTPFKSLYSSPFLEKHRELRGLTSAGRKYRGLQGKVNNKQSIFSLTPFFRFLRK